jgi:hypothetical protein
VLPAIGERHDSCVCCGEADHSPAVSLKINVPGPLTLQSNLNGTETLIIRGLGHTPPALATPAGGSVPLAGVTMSGSVRPVRRAARGRSR